MERNDLILLVVLVILAFFVGMYYNSLKTSIEFTGQASRGTLLKGSTLGSKDVQSDCYDRCLTACGASGINPPTCHERCAPKCYGPQPEKKKTEKKKTEPPRAEYE